METAIKTERITILSTPQFKAFLTREARNEGKSLSELVRQRCENRPQDQDEALLLALTAEIKKAAKKAKKSLEEGLTEAEKVLGELRAS